MRDHRVSEAGRRSIRVRQVLQNGLDLFNAAAHWNVYFSERLKDSTNGEGLTDETRGLNAFERTDLHWRFGQIFSGRESSDFIEALRSQNRASEGVVS